MTDIGGRQKAPPPTARRYLLGVLLRNHRDRKRLSREEVATDQAWSSSKVYRLEHGNTRVKTRDVEDLCALYDVSDRDRDTLMRLARNSAQAGWWTAYPNVFTGSFVSFETEAAEIRAYEPELFPGLLQTPRYASVAIRSQRQSASDNDITLRVRARMARQKILIRKPPTRLAVVLNEAAFHRCLGVGDEIAREQFASLLAASDRPNITIRVLTYRAGIHPASEAFASLSFEEPPGLQITFVEGLMGDIYVDSREGNARYDRTWDRLCELALSPKQSVDFLCKRLKGLR